MAHFGVAFFPTDYSIQPIPLARALDAPTRIDLDRYSFRGLPGA